jgi:hypothetical protein
MLRKTVDFLNRWGRRQDLSFPCSWNTDVHMMVQPQLSVCCLIFTHRRPSFIVCQRWACQHVPRVQPFFQHVFHPYLISPAMDHLLVSSLLTYSLCNIACWLAAICMYISPPACRHAWKPAAPCLLPSAPRQLCSMNCISSTPLVPGENLCTHSTSLPSLSHWPRQANSTMHVSMYTTTATIINSMLFCRNLLLPISTLVVSCLCNE